MKPSLVILFILTALPLLTACGTCPPEGSDGAVKGLVIDEETDLSAVVEDRPLGEWLIDERCTCCHDTGKLDAFPGDAAAWAETVERMRGYGSILTEAEAAKLVEYLAVR